MVMMKVENDKDEDIYEFERYLLQRIVFLFRVFAIAKKDYFFWFAISREVRILGLNQRT